MIIHTLAEKINKEGIFEVRVENKQSSYRNEFIDNYEIQIRNFDFNGDLPISNIEGIASVLKRFREKRSNCYFFLASEIAVNDKNIDSEIDFSNCQFLMPVSFNGCTFNKQFRINKGTFTKTAEFKKTTFAAGLELLNTTFQHLASFVNSYFGTENGDSSKQRFVNVTFLNRVFFNKCEFNLQFDFLRCTFKGKVQFHGGRFRASVGFENTTFESLVDFYFSHFYKPQLFHLTDFLDRAIFSNVTFHDQLVYLHCKTQKDSYLNFESATFKQSIDISRANFNCDMNFWDIEIPKKRVIPTQFYLYEKSPTDESNRNTKNISNEALKKIRESYRIIKHTLRSTGNEINSLKFKGFEMEVYEKELKIGNKGKTILVFSKWSNRHGLSWGFGVCFTILFTFLTLLVLMLVNPGNELEWAWTQTARQRTFNAFIQILNITDWKLNLWGIDFHDLPSGYAIIYVGRIFIAYGYYQTIAAFRRFGKN